MGRLSYAGFGAWKRQKTAYFRHFLGFSYSKRLFDSVESGFRIMAVKMGRSLFCLALKTEVLRRRQRAIGFKSVLPSFSRERDGRHQQCIPLEH